MTKDNLEGLLDIAFEMEGLITLMLKREDMTPDKIKSLLQKKANSFIALLQSIDSADTAEKIADAATYEETRDALPQQVISPAPENTRLAQSEAKSVIQSKEVLHDLLSKKNTIFTLNDKFRFIRDIFHNDDNEMERTLNLILRMKSMEEVEDYLYNDLCLDPENEDVKAFVDIISLQFT